MARSDYVFYSKPPPHDKVEWVGIQVHVRKNATGEVQVSQMDGCFDEDVGEASLYIWQYGNFSCDCNRANFFGDFVDDDDDLCGDRDILADDCPPGLYSVNIFASSGKLIYQEFDIDGPLPGKPYPLRGVPDGMESLYLPCLGLEIGNG